MIHPPSLLSFVVVTLPPRSLSPLLSPPSLLFSLSPLLALLSPHPLLLLLSSLKFHCTYFQCHPQALEFPAFPREISRIFLQADEARLHETYTKNDHKKIRHQINKCYKVVTVQVVECQYLYVFTYESSRSKVRVREITQRT